MSRTREYRRCFSISALLMGMAAAAPAVQAQTPAPTPTQSVQREHVVKRGDTLWDLARIYYGNPFLWKVIADANRPVVEDPHWIYPVERLVIPGRDTLATQPLGDPLGEPVSMITVSVEPVVVEEPQDTTPTILSTVDTRRPLVSAAEHMTAPWLDVNPEGAILGRIARVADPSISDDKIPQQLYPNARVILGEIRGARMQVGDTIQIVRMGRRLGAYGAIVEPLGILRVDSIGSSVVMAHMLRQYGQARIGDYVIAQPPRPKIGPGDLEAVTDGPEGRLLEFLITAPIHGPGDIAFVSLGASDVRIGDELLVYVPAKRLDNERPDIIPSQPVGVVRVVKVSDHSATVRVTGARNTGFRNGLPAQLVRRAP